MSTGIENPQFLFDHATTAVCVLDAGPLAGLRHRTVIDSRAGASSLALWQEEHEAGFLVPPHLHDCEEIISVIAGSIRARVGTATVDVGPGQSILIPARQLHGFEVTGERSVKLLAIFGSSRPRIFRADGTETIPPWEGGASNHLESSPACPDAPAPRTPVGPGIPAIRQGPGARGAEGAGPAW